MTFFSRLTDIITTNLTALLQEAANPTAALKQMISELEAAVKSARNSASQALSKAQGLKAELDQYQKQMQFWNQKARDAVELNRDDLARRALSRRRELVDLSGALEQQYASAQRMVENLKTTLRAVEARLSEAIRMQHALSHGQSDVAEAEDLAPPTSESGFRRRKVANLEHEIEAAEAEFALRSAALEANQKFLEEAEAEIMERSTLDAELESLKESVKGNEGQ